MVDDGPNGNGDSKQADRIDSTTGNNLSDRITREDLYVLVWSNPVTKVAAHFGVSDVAVKKWCRKLNVPVPGRGYWQRVRSGKKTRKTALNKAKKGNPTWVARPAKRTKATGAVGDERDPPPHRNRFPDEIVVSEELENPHRLVRKTRAALRRARKDEYGVRSAASEQALVVRATEDQIDRALRIADALVKTVEAAGFETTVDYKSDQYGRVITHRSYFMIDDEEVPFYLTEKRRRAERKPTTSERKEEEQWSHYRGRNYYEYGGSGMLSLVLGVPKSYGSRGRISDTKRMPLETRLIKFVDKILWDAVKHKQDRLEAEERHRRWEEEERQRKEAQKRRLEELQRRSYLEMMVEAWERAESIRQFVEATEASLEQRGEGRLSDEDRSWLAWARQYAEQLDPLVGDKLQLTPPEDWRYDPENLRSAVESIRLHLDRTLELRGQRWG